MSSKGQSPGRLEQPKPPQRKVSRERIKPAKQTLEEILAKESNKYQITEHMVREKANKSATLCVVNISAPTEYRGRGKHDNDFDGAYENLYDGLRANPAMKAEDVKGDSHKEIVDKIVIDEFGTPPKRFVEGGKAVVEVFKCVERGMGKTYEDAYRDALAQWIGD